MFDEIIKSGTMYDVLLRKDGIKETVMLMKKSITTSLQMGMCQEWEINIFCELNNIDIDDKHNILNMIKQINEE